jgi:hypothetical protein
MISVESAPVSRFHPILARSINLYIIVEAEWYKISSTDCNKVEKKITPAPDFP